MKEKIKEIIEIYSDYGYGEWSGIKEHQIESFVSEILDAQPLEAVESGWVKVESEKDYPTEQGWYWVTIDFKGTTETILAELQEGTWFDEMGGFLFWKILAYMPYFAPAPFDSSERSEVEDGK